MKSATSLTSPSNGLSGIQFSILNVFESLISKNKKKYNNTEMKSGLLFTAATQHLTLLKCLMNRPHRNRFKRLLQDKSSIQGDIFVVFCWILSRTDSVMVMWRLFQLILLRKTSVAIPALFQARASTYLESLMLWIACFLLK